MDSVEKKTLVIVGPTAVGKTKLGLSLAQKHGGEIISADSRQVYKYLDIGTGKDVGGTKFIDRSQDLLSNKGQHSPYTLGYYLVEKIPIWMLDVVEPDYRFSVADFVKLAQLVLKDICSRQKLPLVVGGSGFYLGGLIDGYETMSIPPNLELRAKLERSELSQLQEYLRQIAPERWKGQNTSDRQNPRRLIRAIEVAEAKKTQKLTCSESADLGETLLLLLAAPRKQIYKWIDQRVEERLTQGITGEVQKVIGLGFSWDDPGLNTLGYKQLRPYFAAEQSLEEAVLHWKAAEHQYARQQEQWFKRDLRYQPFAVTEPGLPENVGRVVGKWLG